MRIIVLFTYLVMFLTIGRAQLARMEIPRAWDDREVATFQVPLARDRSPRFMTSDHTQANAARLPKLSRASRPSPSGASRR